MPQRGRSLLQRLPKALYSGKINLRSLLTTLYFSMSLVVICNSMVDVIALWRYSSGWEE
jgi:DICT domain-containing protein